MEPSLCTTHSTLGHIYTDLPIGSAGADMLAVEVMDYMPCSPLANTSSSSHT